MKKPVKGSKSNTLRIRKGTRRKKKITKSSMAKSNKEKKLKRNPKLIDSFKIY